MAFPVSAIGRPSTGYWLCRFNGTEIEHVSKAASVVVRDGRYIDVYAHDMTAPEAERLIKDLRKKIDEVRNKNRPHRKIGDY